MTTEDLAAMDAAIQTALEEGIVMGAFYPRDRDRIVYRAGMVAGRKEAEAENAALLSLLIRWYETYSGSTWPRSGREVDAELDEETAIVIRTEPTP